LNYTAFNTEDFDFRKEPMFFGKQLGVARTDIAKYQVFNDLTEKQLSFFWRPEEVDITTDRRQFKDLPPNEQHIFTSNLKYQTLLDSVQGRAPEQIFGPLCSLPELGNWISKWNFSETIHSDSYTHIIRGVYTMPKAQFDEIVRTPEILERAISVTSDYDKLAHMSHIYELGLNHRDGLGWVPFKLRDLKRQLLITMFQVQIVEAIRFYVSFACSFSFAERSVMEGNAKIIKLIARDEALHFISTQEILKLWKSGRDDAEMGELYAELESSGALVQMYDDAVVQESEWADYLFKDGSMVGINADMLKKYVRYMANLRMKQVGLPQPYDSHVNPFPWMSTWLSSDSVQVAPQEVELSSYLTGQIDTSIADDDFGDMEL